MGTEPPVVFVIKIVTALLFLRDAAAYPLNVRFLLGIMRPQHMQGSRLFG